ncbi:hypothetical protein UlMin_036325 [Ulmus minor]
MAAAAAEEAVLLHEDGEAGGGGDGVLSNSAEEDDKGAVGNEDGGRNYGGNRWPRQETLALLKIRSDMDAKFRDSSLKGPLWEEISRKLAELGYKRSAKKCKEKFENVYKYHKRTKEGRTGKSEGKTYRFFDQLAAFDHQNHRPNPPPTPTPPPKPAQVTTTAQPPPWTTSSNPPSVSPFFVNQPTTNPTNNVNNIVLPQLLPISNPTDSLPQPPSTFPPHSVASAAAVAANHHHLFSSSTSSSTASDEEFQARHKRKRKWKDFFRKLTKEVIRKQEDLQRKFLEAVERCEHKRMAREEAWRAQEMARINHEHEILVQERSKAAAKDAAVIAFLHKVSGQQSSIELLRDIAVINPISSSLCPPPPPTQPPQADQPVAPSFSLTNLEVPKLDNNGGENNGIGNRVSASSSRWPKTEVQALINLRTNLDLKYQDNAPKGPLWEEISAGMRRLGYNRSSKRCKEKWENINKYFKKVKDSNKKRSGDSKTCPYFQQLDALYKEKKIKTNDQSSTINGEKPQFGVEPLMVQPERQWPMLENGSDPMVEDNSDPNRDQEEDDDEEEEDRDSSSTEEEDEEGGAGSYTIVTSKQASNDKMVE